MAKRTNFRIGNSVEVISGFYKGEVGEIIKLLPNKVIIKGINYKSKHIRPNKNETTDTKIGEIRQVEAPIHCSNVKLN